MLEKALVSAGDITAKVKANDQLQSALKSIFAIAENYPNLKANENFLELQKELSTTEDKISYSRQYYNDSILAYNTLCTAFLEHSSQEFTERSQGSICR